MILTRLLPVLVVIGALTVSCGCRRNTGMNSSEQDYARRGQPTSDTPYTHMKDHGSTPEEQATSNQPDGKMPDSVKTNVGQPNAIDNTPGAKS